MVSFSISVTQNTGVSIQTGEHRLLHYVIIKYLSFLSTFISELIWAFLKCLVMFKILVYA